MQRKRKSIQLPAGRGFTLVELLVTVAIIAVLASVLLPALSTARQTAKQLRCASNLREIGRAIMFYVDAYNGALPTAEAAHYAEGSANWWEHKAFLATLALEPFPCGPSVLTCPEDSLPDFYKSGAPMSCWSSYGANASCFGMQRGGSKRGRRLSQVQQPAEALAFADAEFDEGEALVVGHQDCVLIAFAYRHRGRAEAVFLDTHVETITAADVPTGEDAWRDPFWGNLPQFWEY
uniref:Uncharacterized protein n=1 Tax=uncultured Planctomycetota bacterium TaxID=120965 RepID=A0A5B8KII5_9BACT|nr:hypothetical protein fos2004AM_00017 [uncultured Planctomycetota bacterium]